MSEGQSTNGIAQILKVALVQTQVPVEAWSRFPGRNANIEWRVWQELRLALRGLQDESGKAPPKIVLIPELSVPESRIRELKKIAGSLKAALMCGVDYKLDFKTKLVANRACVIVPYDWPECARVGAAREVYVGKTYPGLAEDAHLAARKWDFKPDSAVYLFTSRAYGRIGLCICYDFLDVERHLMYRGKIQPLVVLSYNRDFDSFYYNAEALARTLYCNVVVCNTGTHGGSLAVTPFYEPFMRTIYRHQGRQLSNVQVLELPVSDLLAAQTGKFDDQRRDELKRSGQRRAPKKSGAVPKWKSLPPGYPRKRPANPTSLVQTELDLGD